MKRLITLLTIVTLASSTLFAQDDIYFTPKSKAAKQKELAEAKAAEAKRMEEAAIAAAKQKAIKDSIILEQKKQWMRKNRHRLSQTEDGQIVYHRGRDCSDDEYNRKGKFKSTVALVQPDSVASDIIDFTIGDGKYPDSISTAYRIDTVIVYKEKISPSYDDIEDYYYSRIMNRFDYYYGSRRAWMLYNNPWSSYWAYDPFFWCDPWYWNSSWVYSPWYWNDPWFYGGYYSGYYGGWYGHPYSGYYGGWTYSPGHHHHHYTPVSMGGNIVGHKGSYQRPTHGTQSHRKTTSRDMATGVRSFDRPTSSGSFSGYRGGSSSSGYSQSSSGSSDSGRSYSSRSSSSSSSSFGSNSSSSSSSRSSSSSSSYSRSPSSSSSSSSSGGGSFGGSRGGGGGGGHFGGRR